jgi:hypothetical protein
MNIIHYQQIGADELVSRLKKVPLRGFGNPMAYEGASLALVKDFNTDLLVPPQRYVMTGGVQTILDLADSFEEKGIDVFSLSGAIFFWLEGMDPEKDPCIPFLPPIVEESCNRENVPLLLINDGMHRVSAARKRDRRINIILATNVKYPYYAYPFEGGWNNIKEFDELPDEFLKKDYRNPVGYKDLFRQFNVVFPGIQEQRKQSNPDYIKV